MSGEVSWSLSQYSMACRSYVCPSCVTTGSSMSSCVIGQKKWGGRFSSRPRRSPLPADRLVVVVVAAAESAPNLWPAAALGVDGGRSGQLPAAAAKEDCGRCMLDGARRSREACVPAFWVAACDLWMRVRSASKGSIMVPAAAAAPEQGASGDQPGAGRPGAGPVLGKAGTPAGVGARAATAAGMAAAVAAAVAAAGGSVEHRLAEAVEAAQAQEHLEKVSRFGRMGEAVKLVQ